METSTVRNTLQGYFTEKARWRAEKAEEYPEDGRNAASAAGLDAVARFVAALPDDDPNLVALAGVPRPESVFLDGVFLPPFNPDETDLSEADVQASRFRFDLPDEGEAAFFSRFTKLVQQQAWSHAKWILQQDLKGPHQGPAN